MAAFAVPWSWNHDQVLLLWLALCGALVLGVWVTVWLRGGNEAVAVRWRRTLTRTAAGMTGKKLWRNPWFWGSVAVVLAFIYNMAEHS